MPSVYLEDHELIDLIVERPHLISEAIQKLIVDLEEEREFGCRTYNTNQALRRELNELVKGKKS